MQTYRGGMGDTHVFALFADLDGTVTDSCDGVKRFGYDRQLIVGKALADLFPLVRDAPSHIRTLGSGVPYQIQNNTLALRDGGTAPIESFFVPVEDGHVIKYRIFNIARAK